MSYLYSKSNRLEEPHNYMYTPFQGEALFQSYQSSRMAVMRRCAVIERAIAEPDAMLVAYTLPVLETLFTTTSFEWLGEFRALLEGGGAKSKAQGGSLNDLGSGLEKLTMLESVNTLNLLHVLIAAQLSGGQDGNTKIWLDRLIQRFEVTKKIYEVYPPGFRKGEGENSSVRLYWLLALALCLYYAKSSNLKYLSTLLKVCDLLCSLPENMLQEHIPERGLLVVLATEIVSVQMLAEKKGISFAPK